MISSKKALQIGLLNNQRQKPLRDAVLGAVYRQESNFSKDTSSTIFSSTVPSDLSHLEAIRIIPGAGRIYLLWHGWNMILLHYTEEKLHRKFSK